MERERFIKLLSAGLVSPSIFFIACKGKGKEKKSIVEKQKKQIGITPNAKKAKSVQKIEKDQVNVKDFGAKGDGSGVDDQPAIQKAIDYAFENDVGPVIIPEGDYTVNIVDNPDGRDSSIILKDGIHLKMDDNATLRLPPNENRTSYNILRIKKVDNVTVEGGTIIGNKSTTSATTGAEGLGIGIYVSSNSTIKQTTIKECWGDGIYLLKGNNIIMRNVICDNNRRQGMSVIYVDGLDVKDCQFNNTNGQSPESGIDFEPWRKWHKLKNIKLENVKCIGNAGKGVMVYAKKIDSNNPEISMELNNIHVEDSGIAGISISSFDSAGTGYVSIENSTVKNNGTGSAYQILKWHKDAPSIKLKNIVAINPNLSGAGGLQLGSALTFNSDGGYKNGNLHVDGFEVKNDDSAVSKAPKDIYVDPNLWNCSFKNIESNIRQIKSLLQLKPNRNNSFGSSLNERLKLFSSKSK